jgi:hypothetical protein
MASRQMRSWHATRQAGRRPLATRYRRLVSQGWGQSDVRGGRARYRACGYTGRHTGGAKPARAWSNDSGIVIDDGRVVNVVEDDVSRGRRHIGRRISP